MDLTNLLGYAAGSLTTIAFIPQVFRSWKTRSTTDISWGMLLIFISGVAIWLAYGLALKSWPIILCNGVTFVLNLVIVFVKVRNGVAPAAIRAAEESR
jgi:MtN3 and saliva related transmembrane protein